jgi:LacI family transcriptional regulator
MTIKEIARLSGVSTATVSHVINNSKNVTPKTKKRVLNVINQSGYQPNSIAKSLRVNSTRTIGVLVEDIRGFSVPAIVGAISEYAEQHKYQILLNDLHMLESLLNRYDQISSLKDKINKAISWLLDGARVDAIIYVGMFDREITGILDKIEKPLVMAYSLTNEPWNHCVTYDSKNISAEIINYLFKMGHEQIGIITGLAHTFPAKMRLSGIQQAYSEAGRALDSSLVKNGDWSYQTGYDCMIELLDLEHKPTAIFAMNDIMAAGAMNAIKDRGLSVPGDISMVGFDDRDMSLYLRPSLTTVSIDLKKIGLMAAQIIIDKLNNSSETYDHLITLPCELKLRDSVIDIRP